MQTDDRPIGIFDSGMGGLTVMKEVVNRLPHENIVYYADAAHCPYGEKSQDEIVRYTEQGVRFLLDQQVKIIIIACNTASSVAVEYLRKHYDIGFIAMEPAIKPAVTTTRTGVIGVLATQRTIEGEAMKKLCLRWSTKAQIELQAGLGLVEIVENDSERTPESIRLVKRYISHFIDKNVDKIVLGCTHYPFLTEQMQEAIGNHPIELINPAPAISLRLENLLYEQNLQNTNTTSPSYQFCSSLTETYNHRLKTKIGL